MFLTLSLAVLAVIAYAIYTSYFGDVKGDHVNGVNAMIYVEDHQRIIAEKKAARRAAIERAFAPAA